MVCRGLVRLLPLLGYGSRACGCCFWFAVGVAACPVGGAGGVTDCSLVVLGLCDFLFGLAFV